MARQADTIRDLNDRFRNGDPTVPGRLMVTTGVQQVIADHESKSLADVIQAVHDFAAFSQDNDPHGEHDFGAFEFLQERLFWKIDYYAPDLQHGSENPADTTATVRVLTIMLAEEY